MSTEPSKVIYSMVGVSKFYNKKPVLKDIYLSYFYGGVKIGELGLNCSGKTCGLRVSDEVNFRIGATSHAAPSVRESCLMS